MRSVYSKNDMKAFFLTALCALTLVACGGNQNNKTKEPTAEPATEQDLQDVQDLQDELETPIPQGSDGIAFEFYKLRLAHLGEDVDDEECPEGVTLTYTHSMDDIEGYFADGTHSCFPLSGGGWMFVYEGIEAAEGSPGFFTYEPYTYKDGELTEVQALPVPAFDEIFDEDAVDPGNRDLIPRLKANYKERRRALRRDRRRAAQPRRRRSGDGDRRVAGVLLGIPPGLQRHPGLPLERQGFRKITAP